jgi:hypothetical protein
MITRRKVLAAAIGIALAPKVLQKSNSLVNIEKAKELAIKWYTADSASGLNLTLVKEASSYLESFQISPDAVGKYIVFTFEDTL